LGRLITRSDNEALAAAAAQKADAKRAEQVGSQQIMLYNKLRSIFLQCSRAM
jgi:hypothetical protein